MENYKKKYEQALENLKRIKTANKDNNELIDFIEYKYPELKESEDEKIRKALIEIVKTKSEFCGGEWKIGDYSEEQVIAWLEKQGEEKPSDKVEPKFKVGSWVVYNENIYQIYNISLKKYYECLRIDGTVHTFDFEYIDSKSHLWTIQDAKDGDVLAVDGGSGICIFDGTVEEGIYPFAYCGLTRYGFESYDRKLPFTHDKDIHPATKEQHDLLFQKLKEAGYEWNSERLELKKIEQKPVWSEEDEDMIDLLVNILEINHPNDYFKANQKDEVGITAVSTKKIISWLKSLKERMKEE